MALALVAVYRDLLAAAPTRAEPPPQRLAALSDPCLAALTQCCARHSDYFQGIFETYGADVFGPGGLLGALQHHGPAALAQIRRVTSHVALEPLVASLLEMSQSHLPLPVGDCYLATLFFMAPAATLSIGGRPAMALGLERFEPAPLSRTPPRSFYNPDELAEMVPHEACHVVRMQALGLPPTPKRLSLLDMVMLEGTALSFTDALVRRATLCTFMPAADIARHQGRERAYLAQLAREISLAGLPAFRQYFGPTSPVSGYYLGYRLCQNYLARTGSPLPELVITPSRRIWDVATA